MNYAAARWDDAEVVKALLTPFEEFVALQVALVLDLEVALLRIRKEARDIDLHRVVNHQINGDLWVHPLRIAAQCHHRISQGSDIDHGGNSGEILQKHPAGAEWDLCRSHGRRPCSDASDIVLGHEEAVTVPQSRFKKYSYRYREFFQVAGCLPLKSI